METIVPTTLRRTITRTAAPRAFRRVLVVELAMFYALYRRLKKGAGG